MTPRDAPSILDAPQEKEVDSCRSAAVEPSTVTSSSALRRTSDEVAVTARGERASCPVIGPEFEIQRRPPKALTAHRFDAAASSGEVGHPARP